MDKQFNMFECMYEKYKINKPIRLIELFGGIGSQAKALENLKADFTHYKLVEFDKYPVASYNAIHGTNFKTMDITKIHANDLEIVDRDKYEYIMTYSFPCTDLSLAGLGKGMKKGSGTRSGLLWEVERLINECGNNLPQVLLMENVPQVIGEKNKADFDLWVRFLESKGYSNYYQLLNAKNYGIPQNRNRCFMVSILGDYYYEFPIKEELKLRLKDLLEENVDEKYYLSEKMIKYIIADNEKWTGNNDKSLINKTIVSTINTGEGSRRCDASNYVCEDLPEEYNLKVKNATKQGYLLAEDGDGIDISSRMQYHRGTVQKNMAQTLNTNADVGVVVKDEYLKTDLCNKLIEYGLVKEYDVVKHSYTSQILDGNKKCVEKTDGTMVALTTRADCLGVVVKDEPKVIGGIGDKKSNDGTQWYQQDRVYDDNVAISVTTTCNPYYLSDLRIRKLTPKECWRLMGFADEDYEKASKVNSAAQLYKQAGNSIVVNVLMKIFKEML